MLSCTARPSKGRTHRRLRYQAHRNRSPISHLISISTLTLPLRSDMRSPNDPVHYTYSILPTPTISYHPPPRVELTAGRAAARVGGVCAWTPGFTGVGIRLWAQPLFHPFKVFTLRLCAIRACPTPPLSACSRMVGGAHQNCRPLFGPSLTTVMHFASRRQSQRFSSPSPWCAGAYALCQLCQHGDHSAR